MATCPPHLRRAFISDPVAVELRPGEHLYKFVSLPIARHRILESPWWIRQAEFDELQTRAQRLGKPMNEFVRSQLAVAMQWNPGMDSVYIVVLAAPVNAWEGLASGQPVSTSDRTVMFIGGARQLAIPDLVWNQIGVHYVGTLR